jgi:hypothetical protein
MSIPGDAPSKTLSDCRSSRLDGIPGMVKPNEGIIGIAPGFPEEVVVVVGAWVGDEGNVEVVEVGTEVPETLLRDKGTVVVEVGTETPCVELRGRPEGAQAECDPTLGKTSAPLDPLDERSTSPRLMNVAIRMTTAART